MIHAARLSIRLVRFELLAFAFLVAGLMVASLAAITWIESFRPPTSCLTPIAEWDPGCGTLLNGWYGAQQPTVQPLTMLLIVVSFAAGLFLGAPLVAREVERGTSRLAWSLALSRRRWYAARVLPVLLALLVVTYGAGVALDQLTAISVPQVDPDRSFISFGLHGVLITARSAFIFSVGVLTGAVLGRVLPAVIVAALIAAVGIAGGEGVHQRLLRGEAVPTAETAGSPGDLFVDQKFKLPDGRMVDWQYFESGVPPFDEDGNPLYPIVNIVVPADRYPFAEAREALALAAGSAALLAMGLVVTQRRRPE
jgi:hypothetical protein